MAATKKATTKKPKRNVKRSLFERVTSGIAKPTTDDCLRLAHLIAAHSALKWPLDNITYSVGKEVKHGAQITARFRLEPDSPRCFEVRVMLVAASAVWRANLISGPWYKTNPEFSGQETISKMATRLAKKFEGERPVTAPRPSKRRK